MINQATRLQDAQDLTQSVRRPQSLRPPIVRLDSLAKPLP